MKQDNHNSLLYLVDGLLALQLRGLALSLVKNGNLVPV